MTGECKLCKDLKVADFTHASGWVQWCSGIEYRARNREVAGSTHTRSTASNLEQVANLLCAQANSASYPQRDGMSSSYGYGVKA